MDKEIINRVIRIADYIISTNLTIREVGKIFMISKSTVHKDVQERLREIDQERYNLVKKIMNKHLAERHIKGGEATRQLFLRKKQLTL